MLIKNCPCRLCAYWTPEFERLKKELFGADRDFLIDLFISNRKFSRLNSYSEPWKKLHKLNCDNILSEKEIKELRK